MKKGYKIYLQVECHFSYYYSYGSIIYCYIHRKDIKKLHSGGKLMPLPPPATRKGQQ